MFEQHPVPQQISAYQFRLVGDMTLKQFFQLAGGGVIALLIYSAPIASFIKWPLVIISALLGAALAFLPLEERPLEQWVVAFFRSVYSPTMYRWTKPRQAYAFFQAETTTAEPNAPTPKSGTALHNPTLAKLDEGEKSRLSNIAQLLKGGSSVIIEKPAPQTSPPVAAVKKQLNTPTEEVLPFVQTRKEPIAVQRPQSQVYPPSPLPTYQIQQSVQKKSPASVQAQFSPEAAPPSPPTQPNVVVGQVTDSYGKIIEGAILEIIDPQGRPVRALKTNRVGHFLSVTPLSNGIYKIVIEKDGYGFEPLNFEAKGATIPPIAIKAKGVNAQN